MNKLLLLDCDGAIREPASRTQFIQHPLDQQVINGADKAIAHYAQNGWQIIGITNQGGVTAGYKTIEDAIEEQEYTLKLFPEIEGIFFCPDFEGRWCYWVDREEVYKEYRNDTGFKFRKPEPGMLVKATYGLERPNVIWYVGDRDEDLLAAIAAKVNFLDARTWLSPYCYVNSNVVH